ncbi:MAG: 3-hydroxyacyl-CoA dehydrogenase, partial [Burkholderiales bacterium PBB4]
TNFAVTQAGFEANFYDKRYAPSLVQREMVDGGLLGRKSGRGFFSYGPDVAKPAVTAFTAPAFPSVRALHLHGRGVLAERLAAALASAGQTFARIPDSDWVGLVLDGHSLRLTDGRTASSFGSQISVFDLPLLTQPGAALAWAPSASASVEWVTLAAHCLLALGFDAKQVADVPGLVVARTVAMLINEASDAVHQGVCTAQGADDAMQLGVNYPAGPFQWLAQWGAPAVVHLLDHLDAHYRGERYRVSPGLRHRVWQHAA